MREKTDFRPEDRWMNLAFIIGPLSALANLGFNYTFTFDACSRGSKLQLLLTSGICILAALSGVAIARWKSHPESRLGSPIEEIHIERTNWTATAAILLSI
jgi:hypothetical protein